jgi:hypothetical protein
MIVTALLFAAPGRGEFLRKSLEMSDDDIPKTPNEFGERSLKAVLHFWPGSASTRALTVEKCDDGKRYVVEGNHWSVEWAKDEHVAEMRAFMKQYVEGEKSSLDFINTMLRFNQQQR